jgi:hypothetical protein
MIIDSPRLRNAFADRQVRTVLVATIVLLTAVVLGSRPSVLWLVLPCAGLAIAAIARQPILGLVATITTAMLIPVEFSTGREVKLNLAALLVPLVFGLWFLIMVRRRSIHLPQSRTTTPLLLFVLASLLSLVVGTGYWDPAVPRPDNFWLVQLGQWGIFVFSAFAFWLMGSLVHDKTWLRRLVFIYLGIAGTLALLAVFPGGYNLLDRVATFAVRRAPFWLLLAALAGGQLLFNPKLSTRARVFLGATLGAVGIVAVVQQTARLSGVVGVVIPVGILLWFRWPRWRWAYVVLVVITLVAFRSALYDFAGGNDRWDESGGSRLVLSQRVIEVSMRNPITGLGPAAYRFYARMRPLPYLGAYWIDPLINSHNNYVDLFAQVGLLGLGLFLWFAVEVIRLGLRLRVRFTEGFLCGYVNSMLAAWIGSLVIMVLADWILPHVYNIGFSGFQASVLVWLFLGGLVALERMGEEVVV